MIGILSSFHRPLELPFKVYRSTIVAPIAEEIIFRGLVLSGIELLQIGYNRMLYSMHKRKPSESDLKAQKVFRVRISAAIFGLMHITNYPTLSIGAVFQVAHSIFGGLYLGYLKEKTNSLALPILVHASTNVIAHLIRSQSFSPMVSVGLNSSGLFYLYLGGWICHSLFWYLYATDRFNKATSG